MEGDEEMTIREEVYEYIKKHPGCTRAEIYDNSNTCANALGWAVKDLLRLGMILGDGKYPERYRDVVE